LHTITLGDSVAGQTRSELAIMAEHRTKTSYSILLADDDSAARDVLREIVEPFGYRTYLAGDGEEALEIVRNELIHVALFDVHMPKLTGLETLQILRGFGADFPVILITGDASAGLMRLAFQAHAYSVIPKPVSKNVVLHTLGRALDRTYGGS
jgi:two-component system chemotaxis response regulator CheY